MSDDSTAVPAEDGTRPDEPIWTLAEAESLLRRRTKPLRLLRDGDVVARSLTLVFADLDRLRADLASERAKVARLRAAGPNDGYVPNGAIIPLRTLVAWIARLDEPQLRGARRVTNLNDIIARAKRAVVQSDAVRARLADQPDEGGAGDEAPGEDDDFDPIEAVHQLQDEQADRFNCDPPGTAAAERNRIREFNARVEAAPAVDALIERCAQAGYAARYGFEPRMWRAISPQAKGEWCNVVRAVLAEAGRDTAPAEPGEKRSR